MKTFTDIQIIKILIAIITIFLYHFVISVRNIPSIYWTQWGQFSVDIKNIIFLFVHSPKVILCSNKFMDFYTYMLICTSRTTLNLSSRFVSLEQVYVFLLSGSDYTQWRVCDLSCIYERLYTYCFCILYRSMLNHQYCF